MIRDLDEFEKTIASHFQLDFNYRTVFKENSKIPKILAPAQVGYLARCAYRHGLLDSIEYFRELLKYNSKEYINFKLKSIEDASE